MFRTLFFACAVLLLAGTLSAAGEKFTVLDGKEQAVIVFNPTDDANKIVTESKAIVNAYKELAVYLEKATGKKFEIISEEQFDANGDKTAIYVGKCKATQAALGDQLTKLDRDSYIVAVEPKRVFLVGGANWSTYWAVCQFLEDYAGVRWLIPGSLGEDIPSKKAITIEPVKRVEVPVIVSRMLTGGTEGDPCEMWILRQRIHRRYRHHPNQGNIFPAGKYYDTHPEYYPLQKGKRFRPPVENPCSYWQICWSNPDTVEVAAQTAIKYFDENPDKETYSIAPNDGYGFCECPNCKAMWENGRTFYGFPTFMPKLVFAWTNEVAKKVHEKYPNKLIGTIGYNRYLLPPDANDVKLDRKIIPYIHVVIPDNYSPKYKEASRKVVEAWGQRVDQTGLWDYAYGIGCVMPSIYTQIFRETIDHGLKNNVKGFHAECYPNWGLDGPKMYLMTKVLWNPKVDTDAIFNEWNERMFGEAVEPMKKYFLLCEKAWRENDAEASWATVMENLYVRLKEIQFEAFKPNIIEECSGYLEQAKKLAKTETAKQRIEFFTKTWELGVMYANAYWSGQGLDGYIAKETSLADVVKVLKKMPPSFERTYYEEQIQKRVGDDKIAFYPIYKDSYAMQWYMPIPRKTSDKVINWCAEQILKEMKAEDISCEPKHIEERIVKLFGTEGNELYKETVVKIKNTVLNKAKNY